MKLSSGAMGDLGRYRCSCGNLIGECDFWREVKKGMARRGCEFDLACAGTDYRNIESPYARRVLGPMHRGRFLEYLRDLALGLSPFWRRQLPEIHERNRALAASILDLTGAQVVVDSSKIGLRLKYLLKNPRLCVKVIRVIRDGRAVALTYMDPARFADAEDPKRRAGGMGGNRDQERLSMARAAYEWRRCMEEAEQALCGLDRSEWTEVHYEDYCRHPDATLMRLHEFLGVEAGRHVREFRSVEQHVVGNGMRLDTTSEIRLDERWRDVLSREDLDTFNRVAGKINRRHGYV